MNKRHVELDSLRGVAASIVVICHFLTILPLFGDKVIHTNFGNFISVLWNGHSSVIMFFVLSGFVLSLPFYNNSKFNYPNYLIKRFCRIYIPYLVIILITIGVKFISQSKIGSISGLINWATWDIETTFSVFVNHVIFLGEYDANSILMIIWSLVHEMRISLIFPLVVLLLLKVDWKINIASSMVLSFISYLLMKYIPSEFNGTVSTNYFITLHYLSMFVVGALLAKNREFLINKISRIKLKYALLPIGIIFFNYTGIPLAVPIKLLGEYDFNLYMIIKDWFIAFGSALIILASLNSGKFSELLNIRVIRFMGEISYSLYLVHPVVLIGMFHSLYGIVSVPYILIISLVITVIGSFLCHKYVEKPSIKLGKYLTNKMRSSIKIVEKTG